MSYFTAIDGKQEGPFTEAELRQKIGNTVNGQTLVWKEGMADWLPLAQVMPGLVGSFQPPQAVPLSPSEPSPTSWQPASLGARFAAAMIDISPLFIIGIFAGLAVPLVDRATKGSEPSAAFFGMIGILVLIVLAVAVVQIVMLVKYSQSIGKWILKIRIYNVETGLPADWIKTILLRMVVNGLPTGIPLIGPLYSLVDILFIFRPDRRCIHDLIAGTVVGTLPKA